MIRTLVSIEVDLASSLAIRFACRLGSLTEMEIHPVYVKEESAREASFGSGWAGRTWEREVVRRGKEEITEMLSAEMDFCPVLGEPKVVYGERESELAKIARAEEYDLYVEGVHFPWNEGTLHKLIHSKFYQRMPFPLVLVRSLRKVGKVLLICLDGPGTDHLTAAFQRLWRNCPVPLVAASPGETESTERREILTESVVRARQALEESGCTVTIEKSLPADPSLMEESLKDYALTAIAVRRDVKRDAKQLQWLAVMKAATLLVLY